MPYTVSIGSPPCCFSFFRMRRIWLSTVRSVTVTNNGPSDSTGFTMTDGLPVGLSGATISTDGGALPEVVGDAGLVVRAGDPEALAAALDALARLGLDDPVGKHLEGTPETWKDITLRHLLSHTSGIKDFIIDNQRINVAAPDVFESDPVNIIRTVSGLASLTWHKKSMPFMPGI